MHAVKLYPAGATTHSDAGVTRISRCFRALERMAELEMPLLVHGEVTDPAIDVSRLYVSSNIRPVNFTNAAGYRNAKVDALFDEGQKAFKPEDRAVAYKQVQKILADELPVIWLTEYGIVGAWSKKLHGLHTWSAYSYYNFWDTWSDNGK